MGITRGAGKRDRVADIFHARDVVEQPFESQTEAGVGHRTVAPQIPVPMISPMPGANTSMAATVLPSSLSLM